MNNSISLGDRLQSGKKVKCKTCGKGHYVADYPDAKKKHDYHCTVCGEKIHFEENVVVE